MGFVTRLFDPRLKLDAVHGNIPPELKHVVTSDRLCKWKKEKWNKYIGYDYYNKKEFEQRFYKKEIATLEKQITLLKAENEVIRLTLSIGAHSREFERLLFRNKSNLIKCVEKNKKQFNVKKFSKLVQFSKNTYYEWKQLDKRECSRSNNFICVKRHPNRVSFEEENAILELLQNKKYAHYPISALMWKAHYENLVHAGRGVWDRVKKDNQIARLKPKKKKKYYPEGLRATYANEYLHADITYFKIFGGRTYFIYIVKDNFSRYIKAWTVAETINPKTRLMTFKKALSDIKLDPELKVTFIVDSGNENRANITFDFFKGFENIHIQFARKDIHFSNSMIEKYNMDLKYMYLYREQIRNLSQLKKMVDLAVKDHNYTKRMDVLNGQTPYEVYNGIPRKTEWILEQWKQARASRKEKLDRLICCLENID
jgi:transposase InsO family protein